MIMIKKFNELNKLFIFFFSKETKAQLENDFKVTAEFVQADFVADNKASVDRLFSKFDEIGGDFQVRVLKLQNKNQFILLFNDNLFHRDSFIMLVDTFITSLLDRVWKKLLNILIYILIPF